eukprot:TRINITY_DN35684_c0_g1_i1.p1 TRINITY_DN35684_c0_g1~~TRINITY_DN35684_c0_g1_i1.p1  ORF type:complete len:151 (+),score=24.36 TRINITY_DN35684_c0_g1_i1:42-455(+)
MAEQAPADASRVVFEEAQSVSASAIAPEQHLRHGRRCRTEPSADLRGELYEKLATFSSEDSDALRMDDEEHFRMTLCSFFRPKAELDQDVDDENPEDERLEAELGMTPDERRAFRLRMAKKLLLKCLPSSETTSLPF